MSWWLEFFQSPHWAPIPDLHVSSDAASSVGYGARWFADAYKELFLLVLAASLWGHQWSAKWVKFCSDKTTVVEVLWSSTSRDSNLKVLLCHLSLLAAWHSFAFTACHVSGKSNAIVDTISRFEFQQFHQLVPCVSYRNASTSCGLGPAACSLDQNCQFYLSNGLAPSTRQVYRSAQRQFINFSTLDDYVSSNGSLMNKPCCVFVPT